jgi:hypothetical protein
MFLTFDALYLDLMPSTLLCLKIIPSSLVRRLAMQKLRLTDEEDEDDDNDNLAIAAAKGMRS